MTLPPYRYRGARALVILHERELRRFYEVWKRAKAANVPLPQTEDKDYQSLDHLLHHLLRAARGYMVWMCEKLDLPDPEIAPAPAPEHAAELAETYLEHVLEKWRAPLAGADIDRCEVTYKSRWGMDYSIDSMLEHALAHPMRHSFQLEELLAAQAR